MSKRKQLQSQEAQAVARATEELDILTEAIIELEEAINSSKGTEKKQLQAKKADLKLQETINKARQKQAVTKFQSKFGNSMSADNITNGANNLDKPSSKSETVTKFASYADKIGNKAVSAYAQLETIESEKEYERIAAETDILMADIDALGQKAVMAAEMQAKAYTSAIDSSLSNLIDGINEGAYTAASNLIDLGAQSKIFALEQERIDLENKNTKELRTAQKEATFENLGARKTQAITDIVSEATRLAGHAANNVDVKFLGTGFNTGEAPGAIADAAANIAQGIAAANTALTEMEGRLTVQKFENEKKISETRLKYNQEVEKKWIESAANVEKAWLAFAQKLEGGLVNSEAAANDLGISLGLSGKQLESFKRSMFESQVVVSKWGKTLEDMQKLQNAYTDNTGRNIQFSQNDFDTSFALDKLTGKDGLSTQLTSAMELFNHSVSDSNEMFFEMYKNVSKIGLNGRKYLKDLSKNLKLAERFQFKNGVKGMMDMAKWAQNTRFNMDSLDGMLQSFSDNGLEGAITKAAGMQVLGGHFAMGADPLAMMWERYNDPQAFAQRQQDMLKGLGSFDSKTGEVKFNMMEQMQLEQFAKLNGQSVEDMMNQQRQRIKGEQMTNSLSNGVDWSDDEKSLITNKAQLVNGDWKVTMDNGEQKSVSELNQEDLNHLKPEGNEEKLVDYVYDIRDMMTQLTGAKQGATAQLELDGYQQWYEEEQTRIQNVVTDFNTNYEKYLTEFKDKMHLATEAQSTMLDLMNQGNSNIDSASSEILQEGRNIASTLAQVNQILQDSLAGINTNSSNSISPQTRLSTTTSQYEQPDPHHLIKRTPVYETVDGKRVQKKDQWGNPLYHEIGGSVQIVCPTDAIQAPNQRPLPMPIRTNDVSVSANGQPMAVAASRITPINDGEVAMTSPQDHAIFAKTGGPFDTLFNGIFAKVNEISSVMPKSMPYEFPEQSIKELYKPLYSQQNNQGNVSNSPLKVEPITLNINLDGVLGKSKDFMEEITNNPMFIRSLSQLISESMNKNINGGKSTYTGGLPTPRFKGNGY